jgi:ABC-type antimicrobial peptide transport system permease subunit
MGILVGLVLGLWAGRLARAFLYEIPPSDPLTFVLCAGVLGAIGIGAIYFPARRACRIDPAEALRHE